MTSPTNPGDPDIVGMVRNDSRAFDILLEHCLAKPWAGDISREAFRSGARITPDEAIRAIEATDKSAFERGYLLAVANLIHTHGSEVEAMDVLREGGIPKARMELVGFDDFDRQPLRSLYRDMARRDKYERERAERRADNPS